MDENNMRNIKRIIYADPENKIVKLLSFTNEGGNVADPWYSGNFSVCYSDIYRGCEAFLEYLGAVR